MPELPEVETIKRGLKKAIVGKMITDVEIRVSKMFHGNKKDIIGKKIQNVDRRAKQIIIGVAGDKDLLIHLKMTGQLIFDDGKSRVAGGHPSGDWVAKLPNSTTHVIFNFSGGSRLFFNDQRRFGWIKVLGSRELKSKLDEELGIEPFAKDFSAEKLAGIIKNKPRWNIKKILTDQSLISGIGNVYADEALFWAKIRPDRKASEVTAGEVERLHGAIIKALKIGLQYGGSSENTYVKINGSKGQAQEHLQVYARVGTKCSCGGKVKKIRLNGRGTHFCPACQK